MAAGTYGSTTAFPAVVGKTVKYDLTVDVIEFDDALTSISRIIAHSTLPGARHVG